MKASDFQMLIMKHRLTSGSWGGLGPMPLCCPLGAILLEKHPKYESVQVLSVTPEEEIFEDISATIGVPIENLQEFVAQYDARYMQEFYPTRLKPDHIQRALIQLAIEVGLHTGVLEA